MNISQPVGSSIGGVDFGFLSSNEIKALSVKRIISSTTLDSMLLPVPGGLYDCAMGAWGSFRCTTCCLDSFSCPGHPGHIELPLPVYHVSFMDQVLRLLRGQCPYCHRFKLSRAEIQRLTLKLKLLRYGLIEETHTLEDMTIGMIGSKNEHEDEMADEEVEAEEDIEDFMERREKFVRRCIKKAQQSTPHEASVYPEKNATTAVERRAVIKEFLAAIVKPRRCAICKGISPGYRKDRYSKIFRRTLSKKDQASMSVQGLKMKSALVERMYAQTLKEKGKHEIDYDEGVADMDEISSNDEGVGEDITMADDNSSESSEERVVNQDQSVTSLQTDRYMTAAEVHASLVTLFEKEQDILDLVYNSRSNPNKSYHVSANMFFIRNLLVPPNRFRPANYTGDGVLAENAQNNLFKKILTLSQELSKIQAEIQGAPIEAGRRRGLDDLENVGVALQDAVNSLIDADRNPNTTGNKLPAEGIKQKLEKKEGLFRKNMMGKRVNFAARSVISPDPNIETNEIGVPPVFAQKLTYPEPVTSYNYQELKQAVLNGIDTWPGAVAIENENGQVISLKHKNFEERQALANQLLAPSNIHVNGAKNKKVHRHLNNGDIVLMNRQPTLHKPSIMGHRVRVLPGEKTIRMHYANGNTYNADFDGDEMNMHFPQNEIGRAEALQIADTDHQYLSGTAGDPLRGLIQDHLSMGVRLTSRDTFFDQEDYNQILYCSLRPENNHTIGDRIQVLPPAILKPQRLWTGKQCVSTILKNIQPPGHEGITLWGKSKVPAGMWGEDSEEGKVIFKDGELVCGVLDKANLGSSAGGFVHATYEAYGHTSAGKLLSILGRMLTRLEHMWAFSCGIEDLVLTNKGEEDRRGELSRADEIGLRVAAQYVTLDPENVNITELHRRLEEVLRDDTKQEGLDNKSKGELALLSSDITSACLPNGLIKPFPKNQMQAMTNSGAKGSVVNANLISCNLGQQVLEGRRVPIMISGKTLPCFQPFDTHVRAGGYISNRFLTGIKPPEYFFHAMAGREGLIDTAVKTSRSGYLQRCLIKGMEGLKVEYDTSVRNSDGSMVQFLYGEDGLDVAKQKMLSNFRFQADNYMSLYAQHNMRDDWKKVESRDAAKWNKTAIKEVRRTGRIDAKDTALSQFSPSCSIGSTSEKFEIALKDYIKNNPDKLIKDKKKKQDGIVDSRTFHMLMDIKYLKSIVDPGEAVGIIAGQSIGEPSTQMTLNTFHLAGHSAKNVTLGIPRLREIVMTASDHIMTPVMSLYLNPELSKSDGARFAKGISRLTLAEVIDYVTVTEKTGPGVAYSQAKTYSIALQFYPAEEYKDQYAITVEDIATTLEYRFVRLLCKNIKKEIKKKSKEQSDGSSAALPEVGKEAGSIEQFGEAETAADDDAPSDDDGANSDGDDEGDATNAKAKANRSAAVSYEAPDEEEAAIASQIRRETTPDIDSEMEDEGFVGSPKEPAYDSENDVDTSASAAQLARADRVKQANNEVLKFNFDERKGDRCLIRLEYDAESPKLLLLQIVEQACRDAVIQSIPGLNSCTYTEEKGEAVVVTEGVNLLAMRDYQDILNPHRIFTNDIHAMLRLYGVEACRANIIREMFAVFDSHGISVDHRHLNLIADMMTRDGAYSAFNRHGMSSSVSPFMKMSFETTVGFLRDAVLEQDWDDLKNPSSRIVIGKINKVGTGSFDVLLPVQQTSV